MTSATHVSMPLIGQIVKVRRITSEIHTYLIQGKRKITNVNTASREWKEETMRIATALSVVLIALVVMELSEATSPSSGTRRRSSSSSKGSRRRSSSTSKESRRRSTSRGSNSKTKTKITKSTPIEPTTFRSPVIVSQAKLGSRSSNAMFKNAVAGYFVYSYIGQLSSAPVFRQRYPMYRNDVSIPKNRAIRLSYEEEKLMDIKGNLCLGNSSKKQALREGIDDYLVELNTTIKYKETGNTVKYYGMNNTVSLEDVKGQDFEVTSRALYNTSIVAETNCSQVVKRVEGTMVEMYKTNPNGAHAVGVNYNVLLASIIMAGFIDLFKTT